MQKKEGELPKETKERNQKKGSNFKIRYYRSFKETSGLTMPNAEDRPSKMRSENDRFELIAPRLLVILARTICVE